MKICKHETNNSVTVNFTVGADFYEFPSYFIFISEAPVYLKWKDLVCLQGPEKKQGNSCPKGMHEQREEIIPTLKEAICH